MKEKVFIYLQKLKQHMKEEQLLKRKMKMKKKKKKEKKI